MTLAFPNANALTISNVSIFYFFFLSFFILHLKEYKITAHFWCYDHSTSISVCEIWEARVRIQVSKREFHTHIHLN